MDRPRFRAAAGAGLSPAPVPRAPLSLRGLSLSRARLDRVAPRRTDDAWLSTKLADSRTRILVVDDGRALAGEQDGRVALHLLGPAQASPGDRYLLGMDEDEKAYFAAPGSLVEPPDGSARLAGLRQIGSTLDDRDAGLLVEAVALTNWHRTHPRCPRCGSLTEVEAAGHLRRCPVDGSEHYPRTDPAVIMAVLDDDGRVLLGHQPTWPDRRYSTLAGFVEPGESLEAAVRREVFEESGVVVGDVQYAGSQPWPFPSSLMLGFFAYAETSELVLEDPEITEAAWFSRGELLAALNAGELLLPPPVSIARKLIESWYGEPLPPQE